MTAHRGEPVDPPCRLQLSPAEWAEAVRRDAAVIGRWWPDGDPVGRARDALLLSFDAALVGVDRTPHGFLLEGRDRLRLTTHHLCPDPLIHLDPAGDFSWSAHPPGDPRAEAERQGHPRRSAHRRHADLVRAWLVVEAALGTAALDPAVQHLQDKVAEAFGRGSLQRFGEHVRGWGVSDEDLDGELRDVAYADDDRLDALLDALAGG